MNLTFKGEITPKFSTIVDEKPANQNLEIKPFKISDLQYVEEINGGLNLDNDGDKTFSNQMNYNRRKL